MPVSHRSEQFTWHSSAAPHRWDRAISILVLCAVCAAAGYFIGRTASDDEASLGTKTLQTNAPVLGPEAPSARSATAETAEGTHYTTGASKVDQTPRTQPKPEAPVVVLINPNSAENSKEAEKNSKASGSVPSLHVEPKDGVDGLEGPSAEKSKRKKKVVSTSRRHERASQGAGADLEADVRFASPRPQARENIPSRYEPSYVRDYRDLRGYMLR